MTDEKLKSEALLIAKRFDDVDGLWFYYKAVKRLGFDRCYQLASLALQMSREGKINKTPARYFNGCVTKEIGGVNG